MIAHSCDAMAAHHPGPWGAAIDEIFLREDGTWQAVGGVNEYFSIIQFCPFCGVKLADQKGR